MTDIAPLFNMPLTEALEAAQVGVMRQPVFEAW